MFFSGYAVVVDKPTQDGRDVDNDIYNKKFDSLPEFIVSADGYSLELSGADKKSVLSRPFHGGTNQQWTIALSDEGDGSVSIRSESNGRYVGIQTRRSDSPLISTNSPYYWEVLKDGPGYKFLVPNSRLSLSLGASARLRPVEEDEGTRLDRFANSETTVAMLMRVKREEIDSNLKPKAPSQNPNDVESSLRALQQFLSSKEVKAVLQPSQASSPLRPPVKRRRHVVYNTTDICPPKCPGVADLVAITNKGITVVRNTAHPVKRLVHTGFAAPQWVHGRHIRKFADTTGDGFADIVGFGDNGMYVALNNGDNTFGPARRVSASFGYEQGWRLERHIRYLADIRNTGRSDVVAFGDAGVHVALNNGDGTYAPQKLVLKYFGSSDGWSTAKNPRYLADVDGNGFLDIVGFGDNYIWIARGNGDGTFQPAEKVSSDMTYNEGWLCEHHPRFLADMTGNGALDLVGFGSEGVYVAFNTGNGRFLPSQLVLRKFGSNAGFRVEEHLRFVADLTGNGCADILVIGKTGIFVALNDGRGSFPPNAKRVSGHFCVDAGWSSVANNPRILADMTGDGCPDIVGVGSNAVYILYNDGNGNFARKEQFIDGIGSAEPDYNDGDIKVANLSPV